jgi:NAD(P)-dependent dehydrogenase (short-subunit alcohol dehydrogenase family)
MNLAGRTALVTAGSRGLGSEIARELAVAGANVAVTYASDNQAAAAFVAELDAQGHRAPEHPAREHTMSCAKSAHVSVAWTCWCATPVPRAQRH